MVYNIKDFIKDEKNCTPAFVEAIGVMEDGDVLLLGSERYDMRVEGARVEHYFMSNNDYGVKPIALPIINKENITIKGEGAKLVFHGEILPVVVDNSKNITLSGFSIDYAVPMYSQSEIIEATPDKTVIKFDGEQFNCRVDEDGNWCFFSKSEDWKWERHRRSDVITLEFDKEGRPSPYSWPYFPHTNGYEDHGFLDCMYREVELEQLGDNLIAMHGNTGIKHTAGNILVMTWNTREFPGVFTKDSDGVTYTDITLHHTMSMGFITQNTSDITFKRIKAEARRDLGRLLSVSCDATHFVNCRGKIEIADCHFESMMDDACNIHGNYHIYEKQVTPNTLLLRFGHYQQKGANTYRVGDTVNIIDAYTMDIHGEAKVVGFEVINPDNMILKLDREVVAPGEWWVVENISTAPDIHIHDCVSGYNRPRGFLLSSRGKVLIERNSFHNINHGVQLSGELRDWYESGAALDVTIRDNDFTNSAYAGGSAIYSNPKLEATKTNKDLIYNGKLVIENNYFEQADRRILWAEHSAEVIFKNNTFKLNTSLPRHPAHNESGVRVENCGKVDIELPKEI